MIYQKELKNKAEYDLIVCGGGLAGVAAAVSASRQGLRCALVEDRGYLGGVATGALVPHLLGGGRYLADQNRFVHNIGGIFGELSRRMIASGGAIDPEENDYTKKYNPHGWNLTLAAGLICDPEQLKLTLEQMCLEAGVSLYYYTRILDATVSDGKIEGVVVHNKSGMFTLGASYFVDATGDADVAFLAGCPTVMGREEDGLTVPVSLEMIMEGIDTDALEAYIYEHDEPRFRKLIARLREEGEWDFIYDVMISVQLTRSDVYMLNTIRQVEVNGIDGDALTAATYKGREENYRLAEVLRKHFPGFENARIRAIAPTMGVRETRRIVGLMTVKNQDLIDGIQPDDVIGYTSYGWDMPDPKKPSLQPMKEQKRGSVFTPIPFGCMVPLGVDNLICAGRCISSEREALGALRVMAPCMAMGEAAGVAVSLNKKEGRAIRDTDITLLQATLRADGCVLDHPQPNME